MKRKDLMPKLKKLAAANNCTVEDDRDGTTIKVDAKDGFSWEDGERSCQWTPYGSGGDYLPEWRQDGIAEAIERLTEDPPDPVPYLHD